MSGQPANPGLVPQHQSQCPPDFSPGGFFIRDQVSAKTTKPEQSSRRPVTVTARKVLEANSSRMATPIVRPRTIRTAFPPHRPSGHSGPTPPHGTQILHANRAINKVEDVSHHDRTSLFDQVVSERSLVSGSLRRLGKMVSSINPGRGPARAIAGPSPQMPPATPGFTSGLPRVVDGPVQRGGCPHLYMTSGRCRTGGAGPHSEGGSGRKPEPTHRGAIFLSEPGGPACNRRPSAFSPSDSHAAMAPNENTKIVDLYPVIHNPAGNRFANTVPTRGFRSIRSFRLK
jgi:hypothetical protein